MATALESINLSQDALTVFINQHPNRSAVIDAAFEKLYDPQQYIYMHDVHPTGVQLVHAIKAETNAFNAILPRSERMIICYYLPILDLTMEWIDIFYKTAQEFAKSHPVSNMINHHFMICFSYSTEEPLAEKKEELCRLLCRLMTDERGSMVSHQLYLLREEAFRPLDSQEQGLIQLLHIFSRSEYTKVDRISDQYIHYLKMINYSDYYQDQALICNQRLKEIEQWENERKDPGLMNVLSSIQAAAHEPVRRLAETIRMFRKRASLYPVSTTEYTGNPVTGYRRQSTNNRILNRRQEEFVADSRKRLAAEVNFSETIHLIANELFYHDYLELQEMIENDTMHQRIVSCVNAVPASGSVKGKEAELFADMVFERIRMIVQKETGKLEKKRKDVELQKKRYQKEREEAGRYADLWDCFRNVYANTGNILIKGMFCEHHNDIALINHKCSDGWLEHGYEIAEVPTAYRYDPISPCEIALLKEFDMLDLTGEDVMIRLVRMFD